jgi:hypothetical protein
MGNFDKALYNLGDIVNYYGNIGKVIARGIFRKELRYLIYIPSTCNLDDLDFMNSLCSDVESLPDAKGGHYINEINMSLHSLLSLLTNPCSEIDLSTNSNSDDGGLDLL